MGYKYRGHSLITASQAAGNKCETRHTRLLGCSSIHNCLVQVPAPSRAVRFGIDFAATATQHGLEMGKLGVDVHADLNSRKMSHLPCSRESKLLHKPCGHGNFLAKNAHLRTHLTARSHWNQTTISLAEGKCCLRNRQLGVFLQHARNIKGLCLQCELSPAETLLSWADPRRR